MVSITIGLNRENREKDRGQTDHNQGYSKYPSIGVLREAVTFIDWSLLRGVLNRYDHQALSRRLWRLRHNTGKSAIYDHSDCWRRDLYWVSYCLKAPKMLSGDSLRKPACRRHNCGSSYPLSAPGLV